MFSWWPSLDSWAPIVIPTIGLLITTISLLFFKLLWSFIHSRIQAFTTRKLVVMMKPLGLAFTWKLLIISSYIMAPTATLLFGRK